MVELVDTQDLTGYSISLSVNPVTRKGRVSSSLTEATRLGLVVRKGRVGSSPISPTILYV
jgi:hypothetical protein